jgi:hypothetical protein
VTQPDRAPWGPTLVSEYEREFMTTRADHIAWVKERALAELGPGGGGPTVALNSLAVDLMGHPETADHDAIMLGTMEAMSGRLGTDAQMRDWIDGIR